MTNIVMIHPVGSDLLYDLPWRDFNIGDKYFYHNPHPTDKELQ